ncbi:uncharacterized protein LOC125034487 [Penaeus chinensis]|uniref:uncharacterized protein LOC125034487 n=1 Tax=Penaeus chinensis TaxID=139456 RepID=UPI001FB83E39|nr:uncharacterized protein LOC125034487 [Penaeus chinensis]
MGASTDILSSIYLLVSRRGYSLERHEGNRSQKWKLVIRDVQLADQGQYRCQVSTQIPMVISVTLNVTEPQQPSKSSFVAWGPFHFQILNSSCLCPMFHQTSLNVRGNPQGPRIPDPKSEPRARVVDERGTKVHEKHYNSGSMIELKCEIESVPFPPAAVSWRRDATLLSFNTSRGGISVKGDAASGYIRSRLYVADASPADSGLYSCWYGNYTSDTVSVHVIAGENSAAMQHDSLPTTAAADTTSGAPSLSSLLHLYLLAAAFLFASWAAPRCSLRPSRSQPSCDPSSPLAVRVVAGARGFATPVPAARQALCVQR